MSKFLRIGSVIILTSVIFLNLFSLTTTSFAACGCSPDVNIQGVSIVGAITQGNHVTVQVSVLNAKSADQTDYELKVPVGIPQLIFNNTTVPFNITGNTLRILSIDLLINTAAGDFEVVFLLEKSGCICSYSVYHLIVAREHFTPGFYNMTVYNQILVDIEVNNFNNVTNNVYLNMSRIDHVLKIMAAGILVSIGMWGIFNAQPIWIVEDRERRLHHHFKRGLAFVSAAVSEVLFSSYLFAAILPPLLVGVPYGNEIYGLLCAGTALFGVLGIDRMKYRVTTAIFLFITLLMSSFVMAIIVMLCIIASACIYLLQRLARGFTEGHTSPALPPHPVIIKRLKKADKKLVYEL